jgi:hypothetical protein
LENQSKDHVILSKEIMFDKNNCYLIEDVVKNHDKFKKFEANSSNKLEKCELVRPNTSRFNQKPNTTTSSHDSSNEMKENIGCFKKKIRRYCKKGKHEFQFKRETKNSFIKIIFSKPNLCREHNIFSFSVIEVLGGFFINFNLCSWKIF